MHDPHLFLELELSKKQIDSVSYLVGINFGSFIKGYDFGELNYAQIKKGMNDFIKAKGNMRDPEFGKQFKINPEEMNAVLDGFIQKRRAYASALNNEKGQEYIQKFLQEILAADNLAEIVMKPANTAEAE